MAVEPAEAAGVYREANLGLGGFVVPLWRDDFADQIEQVCTDEATAMALRLAGEEGLFAEHRLPAMS